MQDLRDLITAAVAKAIAIHRLEKSVTIKSMLICGELDRLRAALYSGLTDRDFAAKIGLTKDQFIKRILAARVARAFPRAMEMLVAGETQVSHLTMLHAKITEANQDILLDGIRGKTRQDVESLVSRVGFHGEMLGDLGKVSLKLTMSDGQRELLDRAREVLSSCGETPKLADIFEQALEALLDKRDPMRKAERAERRAEVRQRKNEGEGSVAARQATPASVGQEGAAARQEVSSSVGETGVAARQEVSSSVGETGVAARQEASASVGETGAAARQSPHRRPPIPAAVRHAVWRRDAGRCTFTNPDGTRCTERAMLELDHFRVPWGRGGDHTVENLTLRCRFHNLKGAVAAYGSKVMERYLT